MAIRSLAGISLGLLVAVATVPAAATNLQVSPVRVTLEPGQRVAELRASNTGDQPVLVQIDVNDWSQVGGEDRLTPTQEIIATPPVVEIPAGGQQVIRVGLRHDERGAVERAYRLFVTEIPTGEVEYRAAMRIALRLSLPVFVRPVAVADPALEVQRHENGIVLRNTGTAHMKLRSVRVRPDGADWQPVPIPTVAYVLPGAKLPLPLPTASWAGRRLLVEVRTADSGTIDAVLPDA